MATIQCTACKAANSDTEETCARCGEPLAAAKLERTLGELRELNARMQAAQPAKPMFRTFNGIGTKLLDYRPRGDGSWEATRWLVVMMLPIVPLGGYVIQPVKQERTYGRETSTFTMLGRAPLSPWRILRVYAMVAIGLLPLLVGFLNSSTVNRVFGGGPAFFVMLATIVWAAYVILFLIPNEARAYKTATAT